MTTTPRESSLHDVQDAIEALQERTRLAGFALDGNGRAAIVFDGRMTVEFRRVDAQQLELLSPIDETDAITSAKLTKLLQANYLGEATGAGRVAIEPETGRIVLCERIDVAPIDAAGLEGRILSFVKHLAFWHSSAMEQQLEAEPISQAVVADEIMIFRG